jgi:2-polyprenyl-3-methyl-5-hydroxy-6-metoxy-1,4-benzoquinol methylase
MKRRIQPELLDTLPSDDPRALQSRRDLQKINAFMGNPHAIGRRVSKGLGGRTPRTIVDLGCGDGTMLLRIARRRKGAWRPASVVLVDRQPAVSAATRRAFAALSWPIEFSQQDVFEWLAESHPPSDVILANLFLHHFSDQDLRRFFRRVAQHTTLFVASEPRRSRMALGAIRLLPLIGCNRVTRHDARVSVRAGFANHDLSELWPLKDGWQLIEQPAGAFSHCFVARRVEP